MRNQGIREGQHDLLVLLNDRESFLIAMLNEDRATCRSAARHMPMTFQSRPSRPTQYALASLSISTRSVPITFPDGRADTGGQHADVRLDTGKLQGLVDFRGQAIDRHAWTPLPLGFRLTTVSNISDGAGSVAIAARPVFP